MLKPSQMMTNPFLSKVNDEEKTLKESMIEARTPEDNAREAELYRLTGVLTKHFGVRTLGEITPEQFSMLNSKLKEFVLNMLNPGNDPRVDEELRLSGVLRPVGTNKR